MQEKMIAILENYSETHTCSSLITPNDETIPYTPGAEGSNAGLGAVATYSCDPGYTLVGQTTRICKHVNGGTGVTWSGTDITRLSGCVISEDETYF